MSHDGSMPINNFVSRLNHAIGKIAVFSPAHALVKSPHLEQHTAARRPVHRYGVGRPKQMDGLLMVVQDFSKLLDGITRTYRANISPTDPDARIGKRWDQFSEPIRIDHA